jgi:EAL domain-containing protein (putative c-di-GMP-specific phosphodiesterase class I)
LDKIKIDKSFVGLIGTEKANLPVLNTIVKLGRNLNMKITVEGIETDEQATFFRNLNCDYYQGYLFGRPMKQADVAVFILRDTLIDLRDALACGPAEHSSLKGFGSAHFAA